MEKKNKSKTKNKSNAKRDVSNMEVGREVERTNQKDENMENPKNINFAKKNR